MAHDPWSDNYKYEVPKPISYLRSKCEKHPKYQVKRKPSGRCKACWALWKILNVPGYAEQRV